MGLTRAWWCDILAVAMPGVTLSDRFKYHTTGAARRELGLSKEEFNRRLKQGILPPPTHVTEHNIRLFDDNWLQVARAIINEERQRNQRCLDIA